MKKRKSLFPVYAWLFACLLLVLGQVARADKGAIPPPGLVKLEQDAQRAIILHNGKEEVLILGTDLRADKEAEILEFIPLPSEPTVRLAAADSFLKIERLLREEKGIKVIGRDRSKGGGAETAPLTIVLSEKIGLHDVTVVKLDDTAGFSRWVEEWFEKKGIKVAGDLSGIYKNAEDYLNRQIRFFVFDFVKLPTGKRSVEPLLYRFKTDKIYYPLKTSNLAGGEGSVSLILIGPGSLPGNKTPFPYSVTTDLYIPQFELGAEPGIFFELSNSARIRPAELEEIYPQAAEFFSGAKELFIQVLMYSGPYRFPYDISFSASSLDPRAYAWEVLSGKLPWEDNYLLRPVAAVPAIQKSRSEPFVEYAMDHGHFSCRIPATWKLARDPSGDEEAGIFEIRLTKPDKAKPEEGERYFFPNPLIYVGHYTKGNRQGKTCESFLADYLELARSREGSDKSRYEKPKKLAFQGKEAVEYTYQVYQEIPRGPLFVNRFWLQAKFVVIPANEGFFVLAYKSPGEFYDLYLPVFAEVLKTFRSK